MHADASILHTDGPGQTVDDCFLVLVDMSVAVGKPLSVKMHMFQRMVVIVRHGNRLLSSGKSYLLYTVSSCAASPPGGYPGKNKCFDRQPVSLYNNAKRIKEDISYA